MTPEAVYWYASNIIKDQRLEVEATINLTYISSMSIVKMF